MLRADVLIVTAVSEEHQAVLDAGDGKDAWTEHKGPMDLPVAFLDVDAEGGGSLTLAVTQALAMGGPSAAEAIARVVEGHRRLPMPSVVLLEPSCGYTGTLRCTKRSPRGGMTARSRYAASNPSAVCSQVGRDAHRTVDVEAACP
jgi:hypothetical protein